MDQTMFEEKETPTIMDGRVIRWTMKVAWVNKPEISASRNGVGLSGHWPILCEASQIEAVKAQLDEAWKAHRRLARQA